MGVFNDAALALMLSVGHRTGLLQALGEGPATVVELAARADRNARYVQEWLGALTCSGVVEAEQAEGDSVRYRLPVAAVGFLTDLDPETPNLAAEMQYLPVLAGVEDEIVECFTHGGGVPYASFPRFQEVMAVESAMTVVGALDSVVVPLLGGAEDFGRGLDLLDVGCGRGAALVALAEKFPRSRFTGVDLSRDAITHAVAEARGRALSNVDFVELDAATLQQRWPQPSFDRVATFDAVHDQADPAAVLAGIHAVLRPGGRYLAQDIDSSGSHLGDRDHPVGTFLYTISCLHCMTVSLARGGAGLGAMWGVPRARRMFAEAGFGDVTEHRSPHDVQNVYYVCRDS